MMDLVVIEDLERVDKDSLDDSDLPAGICDVTAGVGTHKGGSRNC